MPFSQRNKKMRQTSKLFICITFLITAVFTHLYADAPFKFEKGVAYRLENQANGTYIHIGPGWWNRDGRWDKPEMSFVFPGSPGGLWKFEKTKDGLFYIYNDSKMKNKPKTVFLASPASEGEYLKVAEKKKDNTLWIIKRVLLSGKRDVGFFTIRSKKNNLFLTREMDWNAANLREPPTNNILLMPKDKRHPRTQYWSLEPTINDPIETLAVPQAGWSPWALNKIAVYNSFDKLKKIPNFVLTDGKKFTYKGKAFYWGQYWNKQHFYIINLNKALKGVKSGTFTLKFNGKRVVVRILKNAYTHPYRQFGRDHFSLSDLFDRKWGFVGHWGHLSTWYPKGIIPLGYKNRTWIDETDANKNGITYEVIKPEIPITPEENKNAFLGNWDMTDKASHSFGCDGRVLQSLAELYPLVKEKGVKKSIINEIKFGVRGLLANQDDNGAWRQRTNDWTYWVGTTANIGAGLASVQKLLEKHSKKLAEKNMKSIQKAWDYVYKNRFDRTKWAIKGEGILPDGSVLSIVPQSHRQGYTEAYIAFAVQMFLLTGDKFYEGEVDDIIERAEFGEQTKIHSINGEKFPGEQDFTGSGTSALITLLRYYPFASALAKEKIKTLTVDYYNKHIVNDDILDGPYGKDGNALYHDYTGGQWRLPAEILIACYCYKLFGDKFAQGILLSQRKLDWWTGCNPYYTSLILGVGDRFLLNGWSSYHALGRHVGMNSGPGKWTLEASETNYIGKETTSGGAVALWLGITMLENISKKGIKHIAIYSKNKFKGTYTNLTVGKFSRKQITALGISMDSISSIKLPEDIKVELFSKEDFSGNSVVLTESSPSVKDKLKTIGSMLISKKELIQNQ